MPTNSEQALEKTVADLAYSVLQDRAPALIDYLVGFQILDTNDEGSKVVGVFGCKVGEEWIYLPAFFLNGEMRGMEMMYLKNQDIFVPTQENWVTYVLNRKPVTMGEGTDKTPGEIRGSGMDTRPFRDSPITKSASTPDKFTKAAQKVYETISGYPRTSPHFYATIRKKHNSKSLTKQAHAKQAHTKPAVGIPGWGKRELQPWSAGAVAIFRPLIKTAADTPKEYLRQICENYVPQGKSLPDFISEAGPGTAKLLVQAMTKNSQLANSVMRYYKPESLLVKDYRGGKLHKRASYPSSLNSAGRNTELPFADRLVNVYPDGSYLPANSEQIKQAKSKMEKSASPNVEDVRIVSYTEIKGWGDHAGLTDADKERLLKGEIVIKDNRRDTSTVIKAETNQRAEPVSKTGIYEYISKDGDLVRAMAIRNPVELGYRGEVTSPRAGDYEYNYRRTYSSWLHPDGNCPPDVGGILLINMDGDGVGKFSPKDILARPVPTSFPGLAGIDNTNDLSSMEEGGTYAIVTPFGDGTEAFKVVNKRTLEDGTTLLRVSTYLDIDHTSASAPYDTCNTSIVLTGRGGRKLDLVGETLFVPESARVVKVSVKQREDSEDYTYVPNYGLPEPCKPEEITYTMWNRGVASPMKIFSTGTEYEVTVGNVKTAGYLGYRQALDFLVNQQGVRGDQAQELLKEAQVKNYKHTPLKAFIRHAPGYPRFTKQANPFLNDLISSNYREPDDRGTDSRLGVKTSEPAELDLPIADLLPDSNVAEIYDVDPRLDEDITGMLNQAAETGQKEIFDTAMISGLVRTVDSGNLVDKFIGDMILGMDRIGRTYFLYLQHNEDFSDRYGQDDLLELEDSMKNTFKGVGDLILALKKKSVEASPAMTPNEVFL